MATNGVVNSNGPVGPLSVPFGQVLAPKATTGGGMVGNLSAGATPNVTMLQTQAEMYDALGNAHQVNYVFTNVGTNRWALDVQDRDGASMLPSTGTPAVTDRIEVEFDANGVMTAPAGTGTPPVNTFQFTPPAGSSPPGTARSPST